MFRHLLAASAAGATLLLAILAVPAGCARSSTRSDPATANEGLRARPSEQGAEKATFALG
jgi:hypothetical protein